MMGSKVHLLATIFTAESSINPRVYVHEAKKVRKETKGGFKSISLVAT